MQRGIPDAPAFRSIETQKRKLAAMAKLPDNRRPFDPAKAMRERNAAAAAAKGDTPLTIEQRTPRRHGLRPATKPLLRDE